MRIFFKLLIVLFTPFITILSIGRYKDYKEFSKAGLKDGIAPACCFILYIYEETKFSILGE